MKRKPTREEIFKMSAVEVYKIVLDRVIKIFPAGFWLRPEAISNAAEVTRYLIEHILNWTEEDVKKGFGNNVLNKYKLNGMANTCFSSSPFKVIDNAYPDKFKPWELLRVPNSFWTLKTSSEATKWLIEVKLKFSDDDIRKKLNMKYFNDNGLKGMLIQCFDGSPYKAVENAYPGRYKEWELYCTPKGFWTLETSSEATRWLFEVKLKGWTVEDIKNNITIDTFRKHGLGGMLHQVFDNSTITALNNAYPGIYKREDIKTLSRIKQP